MVFCEPPILIIKYFNRAAKNFLHRIFKKGAFFQLKLCKQLNSSVNGTETYVDFVSRQNYATLNKAKRFFVLIKHNLIYFCPTLLAEIYANCARFCLLL